MHGTMHGDAWWCTWDMPFASFCILLPLASAMDTLQSQGFMRCQHVSTCVNPAMFLLRNIFLGPREFGFQAPWTPWYLLYSAVPFSAGLPSARGDWARARALEPESIGSFKACGGFHGFSWLSNGFPLGSAIQNKPNPGHGSTFRSARAWRAWEGTKATRRRANASTTTIGCYLCLRTARWICWFLLIFGVQNAFETVEAVWSCTCVRRQREREEREKERLKQREEKDRKLEWQQSFGPTLFVKHIKHIKPKTRCPWVFRSISAILIGSLLFLLCKNNL